jgi:hypothetical protein
MLLSLRTNHIALSASNSCPEVSGLVSPGESRGLNSRNTFWSVTRPFFFTLKS